MKAVVYEAFSQPPRLMNVEDPTPERHGVVIQVRGTGSAAATGTAGRGMIRTSNCRMFPGMSLPAS